jgi:hypothetical protein
MGCQDRTLLLDGQRIQFPELPFALAPYLVDHIVSRKYAGAWRFCPSTFHGEPRETDFFRFSGKGSSVRFTGQSRVASVTKGGVLVVLLAAFLLLFLTAVAGKVPNLYRF